MRRRLLLLGAAGVAAFAGLTPPTTASGPSALAPVADYLHQVIQAGPPAGPLVEAVDAATAEPTCASLLPPLARVRPAAEAALHDPDAGESTVKLMGQLLVYGDQVAGSCG